MNDFELKHVIEATLLAAGKPLTLQQFQELFDERECPTEEQFQQAFAELATDYEGRGIEVIEVASGWRIQIRPRMAEVVSRLWQERPSRYSRALLETLALIAYRQPITRSEIEEIRGVSISSTIMRTLQERSWIRTVGHREVPGRPELLGTTREFLDYFGLRSLEQLPTLAELKDLETIGVQLELPAGDVSAESGDVVDAVDAQAAEGGDAVDAQSADDGGNEATAEETGSTASADTDAAAADESALDEQADSSVADDSQLAESAVDGADGARAQAADDQVAVTEDPDADLDDADDEDDDLDGEDDSDDEDDDDDSDDEDDDLDDEDDSDDEDDDLDDEDDSDDEDDDLDDDDDSDDEDDDLDDDDDSDDEDDDFDDEDDSDDEDESDDEDDDEDKQAVAGRGGSE